jgi:hypothetical protein
MQEPNSSDSISVSVREEQLTATKGPFLRLDNRCIALASKSFPVPVSPQTSTEESLAAMSGSISKSFLMVGLLPMIPEKPQSDRTDGTAAEGHSMGRNVSTAPKILPFLSLKTFTLAMTMVCSPPRLTVRTS